MAASSWVGISLTIRVIGNIETIITTQTDVLIELLKGFTMIDTIV